jgi:Flp pilus assembly protein protease CpaA
MIYNLIFIGFMILFSLYDIKSRTIPNRLLIAFLIFVCIIGCIQQYSFLTAFLGMIIVSLPMCLFYKSNKIGGGDIKLTAIMGIYLGFNCMIITFLIAFLICLFYYFIQCIFKNTQGIPLAPFLCMGAIITIFIGGF